MESVDLNPEEYGYRHDDDANLIPQIMGNSMQPESFPTPCKCKKCARENNCICRIRQIECCKYWACKDCNNPYQKFKLKK